MSKHTAIQWCDSTVNPVMGCGGCELWPKPTAIVTVVMAVLKELGHTCSLHHQKQIKEILGGKVSSDIYHARESISAGIVDGISCPISKRGAFKARLSQAIAGAFKCYAGQLHLWRGVNDLKPEKRANPGYARKFEEATPYPGRMKEAAGWSDLSGATSPEKPWLGGMPRLIFISDMGDALTGGVAFEYLRQEIIENVSSAEGQRHVWLWLTKRPARMAQFCDWLLSQSISWPDNLVAMTSVTSEKMIQRVEDLKRVKARYRALSVEPLRSHVDLDLVGIDWLIVGGESALRPSDAAAFELNWARELQEQCEKAEVAFFVKQLGSQPLANGFPLKLKDRHGGDWDEWPKDLRIRNFPSAFLSPLNQSI